LFYNQVSDLKPLLDIQGLNRLWVSNNPLSTTSINTYIPQLIQKGVDVNY